MDTFVEQIVTLRKTPLQKALVVIAWISASLFMAICLAAYLLRILYPLSLLLIILGAAVGLGAWIVTKRMNIEYEYIITNGDFDIDMIVARQKRRRAVSVKCKDIESFGKYIPEEHVNKNYASKLFTCTVDENACYAVIRADGAGTKLLVISPNEKVKTALKKYISRTVIGNAFSGN